MVIVNSEDVTPLILDVSFRKEARKSVGAEIVEEVVAQACGVDVRELKKPRRNWPVKGIAGMMLIKYGNMTQREAACRLGMKTGAGVSCRLRKLTKQMESDKDVSRLVERIINKLDRAC